MKSLAKTAAVALIAVAVANRIPQVRALING
jgi:hypothetical protein